MSFRETDKESLGELFEFLARWIPQTRVFYLDKSEFDSIRDIANRVRDTVEENEIQVLNYLIHALYRDTYVDEYAGDHYSDGDQVVLDVGKLITLVRLTSHALLAMYVEPTTREFVVTERDMVKIKEIADGIRPYLGKKNLEFLEQTMSALEIRHGDNGEV